MFAFVSIGDQYFADGARAGLITAFVVGVVVVLLGDRTTTVYAPRIGQRRKSPHLAGGLKQIVAGPSAARRLRRANQAIHQLEN
jgi:hypothetical protein